MDIALTWNLVLVGMGVILFAYHFLLGQSDTIKMIIAMYVAILTGDGIASVVENYVLRPAPGFEAMAGDSSEIILVSIRLGIFLLSMVILVIKGGFHIKLGYHDHWIIRTIVHGVFSLLGAMLFLSTALIFLSGNSFVEGISQAQTVNIYEQSQFARILIDHYQVFFALPAIAFLISSFVLPHEE